MQLLIIEISTISHIIVVADILKYYLCSALLEDSGSY